jgi:hypothetical protein
MRHKNSEEKIPGKILKCRSRNPTRNPTRKPCEHQRQHNQISSNPAKHLNKTHKKEYVYTMKTSQKRVISERQLRKIIRRELINEVRRQPLTPADIRREAGLALDARWIEPEVW